MLADELASRGWHTQPQMSFGHLPPTIHLTVTAAIAPTAGEFASALAVSVEAARERGPVDLPPALAEAAAGLTPDLVTPELIASLAQTLGIGGGVMGPMAAVNTLLNAAPPALREALLVAFLSLLQTPRQPEG